MIQVTVTLIISITINHSNVVMYQYTIIILSMAVTARDGAVGATRASLRHGARPFFWAQGM